MATPVRDLSQLMIDVSRPNFRQVGLAFIRESWGSRRPRSPLQSAVRVSRRCTGSNAGHDDGLRRGTTQRVGGSGVHLPRLLHRQMSLSYSCVAPVVFKFSRTSNTAVLRMLRGMMLSENPPSFTITVTSEDGENDETVQTTLKFTYSEKYPDEAPLYDILSQENLEDNDVSDILKLLALQAEENLGMVMIFTLVTAVQEKLNEIVDQIKTRREEEKKQKEKEAEEAEKKLFHGTPVTIENFLSWKAKFDAELLEIKKKRMKEEEQAGKNKLRGKQLFETDHNLDTSDIQFLEDAGNNVEVDESLFQEMDDLELEDGEDDPDYNPVAPGSDSD